MKPRFLTKSRFKLALECRTKLYYDGNSEYANQKIEDPFLLALADGGFQVGELAKCYFAGGHEVFTHDHEESVRQTNELLKQEQANALNGYLHMRFYQQSGTDNSPQHTATDENTKQVTQKYVAYAYTTAYPKDAYMGLYIKDLHFYARSYQKLKNGSKYARVTAITVVITIAKKDANGQSVTLCTQKAIIALPGEPVYIEKPGTWDGNQSSES